jgi:hypothetical protein
MKVSKESTAISGYKKTAEEYSFYSAVNLYIIQVRLWYFYLERKITILSSNNPRFPYGDFSKVYPFKMLSYNESIIKILLN